MRIFVDIGSHMGQTLMEVLKPRWRFDQVWAIEPMPREFAAIEEHFTDPRMRFLCAALADRDGEGVMYGTNDLLEASLYPDKADVDASVRTTVNLVDASEFFADLPDADIFVNMNCEGGEGPILDSLLWSGQIKRIKALLVDFDIRKVPSQAKREAHLRRVLTDSGVTWTSDYYPLSPVHAEQIAWWLEHVT